MIYQSHSSKKPSGRFILLIQVGVIFINGLYIVPTMIKGFRGFTLTHESDFFKEKLIFHQNMKEADDWVKALKDEADN